MKSIVLIALAVLCIIAACYCRITSGIAPAFLIIGFIISSLYLSMNIVGLTKKQSIQRDSYQLFQSVVEDFKG
ncbi:hypothetical protein [Alteromonas sp. BMJM2]|uniref:hypothetical protein n=1 Tax=Alteromonas sp. BMJM2 TaxID=2954241 RepID=UPI0022B4F359|nr:hypothetical protein [Alteromonas sp. BMJM2]